MPATNAQSRLKAATNMPTQADYRRVVNVSLSAVKAFREQGEYITIQQMEVLYEIALKPAITMQELMHNTGLALSSISRNISALSDWQSVGKPGLGFVETIEDPEERRRKICFLTVKGRGFVNRILGIVYNEFDASDPWQYPTAKEWLNSLHRPRR